jgi:hypothetical protein
MNLYYLMVLLLLGTVSALSVDAEILKKDKERLTISHHVRAWCYGQGLRGEVRLVERQFGIYAI